MQVTIDEKKKTITIVAPLGEAKVSASGKSNVVFTTNGFTKPGVKVDGKDLSISINAIVPLK